MAPITPSDTSISGLTGTRSPMFLSSSDVTNDEITRLHQQYTKLVQANRR